MSEPTATTDARTTDRGTGDDQLLPDVVGTPTLGTDDLSSVLEEVHDAHSKWYGIGLQLGLASTVLEGIEHQYARTEDMLRAMLKEWLKQVDPVPTWVALIRALKSKTVKEPSLAEQLVGKHHISPLPHGILTHTVSDLNERHKQILGQLQVTTKQYDSQLESYGEILQQSKKADPSDNTLEAAQEKHTRRGQSDETGLRTDPERALHMQLKQLMSRISSLEKMSGVSTVPEETVIKEPDPLKDEIDRLHSHSSELKEELDSLTDKMDRLHRHNTELVEKIADLEERNALLSTEKENLKKENVDKNYEIAKKATDVAEKSDKVGQLENEVQKLTAEKKLLIQKSQRESSDEMPASSVTSDSTEPAVAEQ